MSLHYRHPSGDWEGWIVIDSLVRSRAIGGTRVSASVTSDEVTRLARGMTLKNTALGLDVGGAKAGIRLDPRAPNKREVLETFFWHMRPVCEAMYAFGPDMNTSCEELDAVAAAVGLEWRLGALALGDLAGARRRYDSAVALPAGSLTVGGARTGVGVVAAVERARVLLGMPRTLRGAIQGFGEVGTGVAWRLESRYGHRVVAVADAGGTIVDPHGLDVARLLSAPRASHGLLAPEVCAPEAARLAAEAILGVDCDVLVLAAVPDVVRADNTATVRAKLIAEGGNITVTPAAHRALHARGVTVIPDYIASVGSVLTTCEVIAQRFSDCDAEVLLQQIDDRIADATERAIVAARAIGGTLRDAALPSVGEIHMAQTA